MVSIVFKNKIVVSVVNIITFFLPTDTRQVFKNGKLTTRLRANKSSAVLVNVLWVEK